MYVLIAGTMSDSFFFFFSSFEEIAEAKVLPHFHRLERPAV